ncbi:MAG TPA: DUF6089 family protein [Bacteroidia bacterium]|nr:DUF6089 family protein [Bacteroidia bacterium]
MTRLIATVMLLATLTSTARSQTWSLELFAGAAGYNGDLTKSALVTRSMKPVVALNVKYQIHPQFSLRAGLAFASVSGDDKFTKDSMLMLRNLSFQSSIIEASFVVEAAILDPELFPNYPYLFAGVGAFRFKPFAYDMHNEKVFLRPLRTEGQGLPEYPDRKQYSLTQLCIPFGGGARFKINDQFSISVEAGFRKLFTDHLDDVSNSYVDPMVLKNSVGPKALEMAYRGNEVGSTQFDPYPGNGARRGNPKKDDWYGFAGVKLTWHFIDPYSY